MASDSVQAVFFDLGYTLMYFDPPVEELTLRALREAGLPVGPEQVLPALGRVWKAYELEGIQNPFPPTPEYDAARELEMERQLLRHLGYEDEEIRRRYHERLEALFTQPGVMRLYDDVLPALERLKAQGYRLGIISNWSWNLVDRCRHLGIDGYFDTITASAYVGYNKPHPAIFQHALAQVGVPPAAAVHVGDQYEADVRGAQSAGMTGILLDRRGKAPAASCLVIRGLEELLGWLEEKRASR